MKIPLFSFSLIALLICAIPAPSRSASVSVVADFMPGGTGTKPVAGPVQGADGNLYGTTSYGGSYGQGTVYKLTTSGSQAAKIVGSIVSFDTTNGTGPYSQLILAKDGNFYGTTLGGGAHDDGTVFKVTPAGVLTTLYSFSSTQGSPTAGVIQGTDGNFYGTTYGSFDPTTGMETGIIFKLTSKGILDTLAPVASQSPLIQGKDGNFYCTTDSAVLRITPAGVMTTLATVSTQGGLAQGKDGSLYGASSYDGTSGDGTIYKVTLSGTLSVLVSFNGTNGNEVDPEELPGGGLIAGSDGNLYGTTRTGGAANKGTIFKVTPAGVLTTLASFHGLDGEQPLGDLVVGKDGNFYGTTRHGGASDAGTIFQLTPSGALATLASFSGTTPAVPLTALVHDATSGNLYGTTDAGGLGEDGTVYKLGSAHTLSVLDSFIGNNGAGPDYSFFQGKDGNFYGTTGGFLYPATVFKVTLAGSLTTLSTFAETDSYGNLDVYEPTLIQGTDDNFYGTTDYDGASSDGTIFKLTPGGTRTVLTTLDGKKGANPETPLVQGKDGNFYGITLAGGASSYGTIFKVTPTGVLTDLYDFNSYSGYTPPGALTQGKDGNFYGMTSGSGAFSDGTAFRVTPAGFFTTLATFTGANGGLPTGALLQATDGNFYGTTQQGGTHGDGTVFRMTPAGVLTTLFSFDGANGQYPAAALIQVDSGLLYGTAGNGGTRQSGVIFSVNLGTKAQTITFATPANKVYGSAPFKVDATASSGLTATCSVVSGPATIRSGTLTLTGAGTVVLQADQPGNATWLAAPAVQRKLTVAKAAQTITFPSIGHPSVGVVVTLAAKATSGLAVTYTVSGPARLSGSKLTITGAGSLVVEAHQEGNADWNAAPTETQKITIK